MLPRLYIFQLLKHFRRQWARIRVQPAALATTWLGEKAFARVRWAFGVQIHACQLLAVRDALHRKLKCNFLVFGLGVDSPFWLSANAGNRTAFIEDDPTWFASVMGSIGNLEAYLVSYGTRLADWQQLLREPERLRFVLPPAITDTRWDVILVDAPAGYAPNTPGRMCSIRAASLLAAPEADIFVHDYEREVEQASCAAFLGTAQTWKDIGKRKRVLRHFRFHS